MRNIFAFGASITYGAWDIEKGGWVQRLRNYLESNRGREFLIYNLGISGDTSAMILDRFESDIKFRIDERDKNVVIFSFGINDSIFLQKENKNMTDADVFKKNLEKLFKMALKYSNKIIFVGLTSVDEAQTSPVPWNTNIFYNNENISKYNDIIKDTCQKNDILFVDLYDKIDKDLLVDGLHPNPQGHQKMFEIIKDALIRNKII